MVIGKILEFFSGQKKNPERIKKHNLLIVDFENLVNKLWQTKDLGRLLKVDSYEKYKQLEEGLKEAQEKKNLTLANITQEELKKLADPLAETIVSLIKFTRKVKEGAWCDMVYLIGKVNGHLELLKLVAEKLRRIYKDNCLVVYTLTGNRKESEDDAIKSFVVDLKSNNWRAIEKKTEFSKIATLNFKDKKRQLWEDIKRRLANDKEGILLVSADKDFKTLADRENLAYITRLWYEVRKFPPSCYKLFFKFYYGSYLNSFPILARGCKN